MGNHIPSGSADVFISDKIECYESIRSRNDATDFKDVVRESATEGEDHFARQLRLEQVANDELIEAQVCLSFPFSSLTPLRNRFLFIYLIFYKYLLLLWPVSQQNSAVFSEFKSTSSLLRFSFSYIITMTGSRS
jgi:hypothetical protein